MSFLRYALALAAVLAAFPAPPLAAAPDARVAVLEFVPDKVIGFAARAGFQSTIAFASGERIENIALGESGGWQVTPNRRADLLFVKPASAHAPATNMTVVTDRRTYLFELRLATRSAPVFLLRFSYPADAKEPSPAALSPAAPPPSATPGADKPIEPPLLPLETSPTALNFKWSMTGTRSLFPERAFDDGHAVYLAWKADRALPAVLALGPDCKTEGPVNFTTRGEYLVVDGRYSRLILRSGKAVAVIATTRPDLLEPLANTGNIGSNTDINKAIPHG